MRQQHSDNEARLNKCNFNRVDYVLWSANLANKPFSYSKKEPGSSAIFYTFLYTIFDQVALELLSLLKGFCV